MPASIKTTLLFLVTAIAYLTIGKAPGMIPVRNRDLEMTIASNITVEDRDI
jgi:hypothetical protein